MLARLSKGEANVFDLAKLAGGGGSWTRLAEDLARESSSKEKPAINRLRDVTVSPSFHFFGFSVSFVVVSPLWSWL